MNSPEGGKLTVLHIFSGDLWAGAEVMVFNLLSGLKNDPALKLIALSLNEGILTGKLRKAGIETHVIPEREHSFPMIFLKTFGLLRKSRIDCIHTHRYKENLLGLLLSKVLRVRRLITTMHGMSEPKGGAGVEKGKGRGRGENLSLTTKINYYILKYYFTDVVAVSNEMKGILAREYGFDPARIRVIHNGIPLPPPSPVPLPGFSSASSFHIGTVGRMVPVKDYDLFLEVAAEIRKRTDQVKFSILGDGPLRDRLVQKAKRLGMEDFVEFLSPVEDPLPYYLSLNLYLNTSLHEGIPLSILEAMACGLPVVAPAVGGIPEIVASGENGFLHTARDHNAFTESCTSLLNNPHLRSTMGARNVEKISLFFEVHTMSEKYLALYAAKTARG